MILRYGTKTISPGFLGVCIRIPADTTFDPSSPYVGLPFYRRTFHFRDAAGWTLDIVFMHLR